MLNQLDPLDRALHALADPVRRSLVDRLSHGPASVSQLAEPLDMSLAGVVQHVQVLEQCGVITTEKRGRVRTCSLDPEGLQQVEQWVTSRHALWERRLDALAAVLAEPAPTDTSKEKNP